MRLTYYCVKRWYFYKKFYKKFWLKFDLENRGTFETIFFKKFSPNFSHFLGHFLDHLSDHFSGNHEYPSWDPFFSNFFKKNFQKNDQKFQKKNVPKMAKSAYICSLSPSKPQKTPFSFLYINPYDTGEIFFFLQKCALFGIWKTENFSLDENFGLNPVWKKLWLGGESYKWAKKGLHRAFFIEISLLRCTYGVWSREIFRPTGSIFLHVKNFAKIFRKNLTKISWFFYPKKRSTGRHFFMIFLVLSRAFFSVIFLVIFLVIFSEDFFRKFSWKFFFWILWDNLFSTNSLTRKRWLLLTPTRDVAAMSWASAQWAPQAQLRDPVNVLHRSLKLVTFGNLR